MRQVWFATAIYIQNLDFITKEPSQDCNCDQRIVPFSWENIVFLKGPLSSSLGFFETIVNFNSFEETVVWPLQSMVFQWFWILYPSLSMVFNGSGSLVKRCYGFDGSLWSKHTWECKLNESNSKSFLLKVLFLAKYRLLWLYWYVWDNNIPQVIYLGWQ